MRVEDISPNGKNTTLTQPGSQQSTGGRALTIAGTPDGSRLYIGNNAGVWRSSDSGNIWTHMERPQPKARTVAVPGALLAMNVYDLAVAKDPEIVLACTNYDIRKTGRNGIYRSTDGGTTWSLVQPFAEMGQIITAPENAEVLFAACGSALVKSANSGAAWSNLNVPLSGGSVFSVAAGPIATANQEASRRIYVLGTKLWVSTNGGGAWTVDNTSPLTGSKPSDAVGPTTRVIAIHPANPNILYGVTMAAGGVATVSKGDFSARLLLGHRWRPCQRRIRRALLQVEPNTWLRMLRSRVTSICSPRIGPRSMFRTETCPRHGVNWMRSISVPPARLSG